MNKNSTAAETNVTDIENKIARLQAAHVAVGEKNFTIYLYTPDTQGVPSGAVIEIYRLAATLRQQGYEAVLLTEEKDYQTPSYLDEDLQAIPQLARSSGKLTIKPEDVLVIPEYFSSVIAQTAKLPCTRIVLLQSYDNAVTTMVPGTNWSQLGIKHVWAMSEPLARFTREVLGGTYNIETLRPGIPEYFKPGGIKDPVIAVQVRNATDLQKLANEFYVRFPDLRWVGFEVLNGGGQNEAGEPMLSRTRRDYAKLMRRAAVVLWVDRIATFGQTAIEAMATQTPLVALVPDRDPEYITEQNGVWVNRMSELVPVLGNVFRLQLENGLPETLLPAMAETAATYSPARAEAAVRVAIEHTMSLRAKELKDMVFYYENKLPQTETLVAQTAE